MLCFCVFFRCFFFISIVKNVGFFSIETQEGKLASDSLVRTDENWEGLLFHSSGGPERGGSLSSVHR